MHGASSHDSQPLHHSPLPIPTSCSLDFRLLSLKTRNTNFSSTSTGAHLTQVAESRCHHRRPCWWVMLCKLQWSSKWECVSPFCLLGQESVALSDSVLLKFLSRRPKWWILLLGGDCCPIPSIQDTAPLQLLGSNFYLSVQHQCTLALRLRF